MAPKTSAEKRKAKEVKDAAAASAAAKKQGNDYIFEGLDTSALSKAAATGEKKFFPRPGRGMKLRGKRGRRCIALQRVA
jgi:hypothetical protein